VLSWGMLMKILDKLYVLEMPYKKGKDHLISKIGETTQENMEKRIAGFSFSSKFKGREGEIEIVETYETYLAKALEPIVKRELLKRGYKKVMDKNLGRGYTEWYDCEGSKIISCVLYAFQFIYEKDEKVKAKIQREIDKNVQE
tara:strand:+ start:121 stop:549 length:429 start_codon:yes stop_codon:yes gene_type:complete